MAEDRFAEGALRLWAQAALALGWPPATFWRSTPAELAFLAAPAAQAGPGLSREELLLLMEREHER